MEWVAAGLHLAALGVGSSRHQIISQEGCHKAVLQPTPDKHGVWTARGSVSHSSGGLQGNGVYHGPC